MGVKCEAIAPTMLCSFGGQTANTRGRVGYRARRAISTALPYAAVSGPCEGGDVTGGHTYLRELN